MSQQYLQRVISESSDPLVEPLQTTPGGKAIKQEESTTAAPDYELQPLWAICNSPLASQFFSASNADDDYEYQYYRDRALAYAGTTARDYSANLPWQELLRLSILLRIKLKMMRQSINITDTGLWVFHLGLFQSKISQILEGRVWVSSHSLFLVLVAAPMLPLPLYWIVLQHTLRKDLGLEQTRH